MSNVPGLILAAGGIRMQNGEVLLVYRPRYEDWSFPKGKLDPGETPLEAAIREVREETGYEVEPGELAGAVGYMVRGTPKAVLYWRMTPRKQFAIQDQDEVAELNWLPAGEAVSKLSYERERDLWRKITG